jgi:hypothetical protein
MPLAPLESDGQHGPRTSPATSPGDDSGQLGPRAAPVRLRKGISDKACDWYNNGRLHSSIGYATRTEHENAYYGETNSQNRPVLGEPALH